LALSPIEVSPSKDLEFSPSFPFSDSNSQVNERSLCYTYDVSEDITVNDSPLFHSLALSSPKPPSSSCPLLVLDVCASFSGNFEGWWLMRDYGLGQVFSLLEPG
jgi:hypothetical protein